MTIVADTNFLIELFLPTTNADSVQHWRAVDKDWRLPSLWICEKPGGCRGLFLSQTVHVDSADALQLADSHGCSSYDAEFVVLAQQLACPLLTFDRKLLQLFPQVAVKPGS